MQYEAVQSGIMSSSFYILLGVFYVFCFCCVLLHWSRVLR